MSRPRTDKGRGSPHVFVRLSPEQDEALEREAEKQGISKAECLRRARFGEPVGKDEG